MAHRVRYLRSSALTRKDLGKISDNLSFQEYSEAVVWGFIDIRNEGDVVTGTFVERFETEDIVIDPFGGTLQYNRRQFNQTRFRLGVKPPHLEVYDAPRSITPLLTELSRAVDPGLAFSSIAVGLQDFIHLFMRQTSSLTVVAFTLQDITLATDSFARISVIGTGEVRQHLKLASLGKKISLQKVSLAGTISSGPFKMEITSDARIHLAVGHVEDIFRIARNLITESLM